MTSLTRGPLPARVYWRRRLLVGGTALVLVTAIARVLDGGSDAASEDDRASQVAAASTPSGSISGSTAPDEQPRKKGKKDRKDPTDKEPEDQPSETMPPLAIPEGDCVDGDVAVTPRVDEAVAGRDVLLVLQLRTLAAEACTWRVSPAHLAIKITSGDDDIWSSRECPGVIAAQDVTVRREVTSTIEVVWNAKRSDPVCSSFTEWALPGYYHVIAASLGGEPADVQFELEKPPAEVVTETVTADPEKPQGDRDGKKGEKGKNDGDRSKPDGAQEPDEPKPEKPRRR